MVLNVLSVDGAFEGRFRISSETWNDALSDKGSPMYRAMSARILEELKKIYSADDLNVTIFGFEAGSVIVKFRCKENTRVFVLGPHHGHGTIYYMLICAYWPYRICTCMSITPRNVTVRGTGPNLGTEQRPVKTSPPAPMCLMSNLSNLFD